MLWLFNGIIFRVPSVTSILVVNSLERTRLAVLQSLGDQCSCTTLQYLQLSSVLVVLSLQSSKLRRR